VRGKKGVIDTTRLLRRQPFGEWVNVYYRPGEITEAKLFELIKANRCPRAEQLTAAVTPFAAAGDTLQLKLQSDTETAIKSVDLPDGWKFEDAKVGDPLGAGEIRLSIQVDKKARQGDFDLGVTLADGKVVRGQVSIVGQVGKH